MRHRLTEGRRAASCPTCSARCSRSAPPHAHTRAVAATFDLHDARPAAASDRLLVALRPRASTCNASRSTCRAARAARHGPPMPTGCATRRCRAPRAPDRPARHLLRSTSAALPVWLERRVLGLPPRRNGCERWQAAPEAWLDAGARSATSSAGRVAARRASRRPPSRCRVGRCLLDGATPGLREPGRDAHDDPDFAERPLWRGPPPNRAVDAAWPHVAASVGLSLGRRLGARLADPGAACARRHGLACGALVARAAGGASPGPRCRAGCWCTGCASRRPAGAPTTARARATACSRPPSGTFHPDGPARPRLRSPGSMRRRRPRRRGARPCIRFDAEEAGPCMS